ncbi:TM2 domain-containing protein [Corynebacterium terpenotabidum]|uniref:TM2 domain-containing protein n=1 Tax=Corynebacterium terpenotabidum Y-11 TaxID=1200352 RepID=S4XD01_9CORY|nr:TM2 domain-containing protein [Corynebacterium terpenotabidum]AGP31002.1 hypothetical protein A606_06775 [Corynebacterium terpenotabidum Y-11]
MTVPRAHGWGEQYPQYSGPAGATGYPQNYPQDGYSQNYQQVGYQQAYPQTAYQSGYAPMGGVSPKSRGIGALLAFFFGFCGAHNFYFGKKNRGIAQLCMTGGGWALLFFFPVVLSLGIGNNTVIGIFELVRIVGVLLLFLGVGIWAFVEFIMILGKAETYRYDGDGLVIQ